MSKRPSSANLLSSGEGKRGEKGHLGYLLRQAVTAYRLRMERALAGVDITLPQFRVLTKLAAYPGISNADLARLTQLTPQTVSATIANLERAGLVSRRPHEVHGRIQHLDITENGRTLLTTSRTRVRAIERELMEGLSPEEEQTIRRWLVRVATTEDAEA
ncbi:MAG TPA: MarR family transcriptional regulator [Deltaproteobacteria bacterium]|nr:MarR family transcriptional regulator [Deltaproteobacteria bacterium]